MLPLPADSIHQLSQYFSQKESILAVYLLGSAVRGELREDSDIDLAILPFLGQKIPSMDLFQITGESGYQFGYDFDLGVIGTENLIYSKEAIFTGQAIFVRSKGETWKRVNTILPMYYNFQIERKIVEDGYRIR